MAAFNVLNKKKKKFKKFNFAKCKYLKYHKLPVNPQYIFLEWQHGIGVQGNIYYILRELTSNPIYSNYSIYIGIRKDRQSQTQEFLERNGIKGYEFIILNTEEYYRMLSISKYLMTDVSFEPFYIKRDEQICINTWHGTPLKALGKRVVGEQHSLGNIQKNFLIADYLLYPNEFTMKHMVEDYMLENICHAKVLLSGYPRNEAFFDLKKSELIREEYDWQDKEIYVYMPTWRGSLKSINNIVHQSYLVYYLVELDKQLKDNQVFYVKLHPFVNRLIDFRVFKNIKQLPADYETYETLAAADVLITDYSSVMFDFAVTGKKVLLFTYDEEDYLENRGMYLQLDDLPFTRAKDLNELVANLNITKEYDDKDFLNTYCAYDSINASKELCEKVILNKQNNIIECSIPCNEKENVLIYAGNLAKNGITTSLLNLLSNIDTTKRNYYITFAARLVWRHKQEILKLPEGVNYIGMIGEVNLTLFQRYLRRLYLKKLIPTSLYLHFTRDALQLEKKRVYGDIEFNHVIQYNGYDYEKILFYSQFKCKRTIYVHNDMVNEIKSKGNQHRKTLVYAYRNYDNVALVTEDMKATTQKLSRKDNNFVIAHNLINYKLIQEKSNWPIAYDDTTEANIEVDRLNNILDDKESKVFINIGRFSSEKGQLRLLKAFNQLYKELGEHLYLIIIGGYGKEYQQIVETAESYGHNEHIIIIKNIDNPYAILKKCDYFVLSSFYEGFGLVLAEADILGLPVISTDICGPREFFGRYGGTFVENTEDGIYQGMKRLYNNEIKPINVDYESYNQNAIAQFENILKQ